MWGFAKGKLNQSYTLLPNNTKQKTNNKQSENNNKQKENNNKQKKTTII